MIKTQKLWWFLALSAVGAWTLLIGLLLRPPAFLLLAASDGLVGRKPYGGWYGLKCDCFNDLIDDYNDIKRGMGELWRMKL